MEKIAQLLSEANQAYKIADHLAYSTYPVVKDVKMLLLITEDLYKAMHKTMEAVLRYDRLYKRISPVVGDFETELEIFKDHCAKRYNIDREQILVIADLRRILNEHKKSPMEFVRRDKFVICTEGYRMTTLNFQKVKLYMGQAKVFIDKVNRLLRQK